MAALLKENGEFRPEPLRVKPEAAERFVRAIDNPKKPPQKLIELMKAKRESAKSA